MKPGENQITIRMPAPMREALERAAAADDRTLSSYVRRVMARALNELHGEGKS